jgi:phosphoribosyl 1,2-cyclic phosphodiesterase
MLARVWGCRGSLATPGVETTRYGGNTSCVEIRTSDGTLVVLDAGTGIRRLGLSLTPDRPRTVHLLLTHMHLDHVEGLGFFLPLFDADTEISVWGPPWPGRPLGERIAAYLSPPLFPLPFETIPAQFSFHEVGDEPWEVGSLRVTAGIVKHPGPTVAYRLEEDGRSLAFVPDNEPALDVDVASAPVDDLSGYAVASGVDVLLHDAQYTEEEYTTRKGWGHSSVPDFVKFVRRAAPRRVVMFHHDPSHSDDMLEVMRASAVDLSGEAAPPIELAREGMEIALG